LKYPELTGSFFFFFKYPEVVVVFKKKKQITTQHQFKNWTENWPRTHTENTGVDRMQTIKLNKSWAVLNWTCGDWTENSNVQGKSLLKAQG
jgi:hypothetical protein